jgi:hypothetical protein
MAVLERISICLRGLLFRSSWYLGFFNSSLQFLFVRTVLDTYNFNSAARLGSLPCYHLLRLCFYIYRPPLHESLEDIVV